MAELWGRVKQWFLAEEEDDTEVNGHHLEPVDGFRALPRGEYVFVRRPRTTDDATQAADCLKARRPVVVSLVRMDPAQGQRCFDFLKGVVYALDGEIEQVADGIFLLTPSTMAINADADIDLPSAQREFWSSTRTN